MLEGIAKTLGHARRVPELKKKLIPLEYWILWAIVCWSKVFLEKLQTTLDMMKGDIDGNLHKLLRD